MLELITDLGAWKWLIAALVLFLLETILPGVLLMWFGMAAVVVGLLSLVLNIEWQWQAILFALLSVASVFAVRRFGLGLSRPTDEPLLNNRAAQHIGRTVTVADAIEMGRGQVIIGDTRWTAEGPDLAAGARAKVVGVNGTTLLVEPAERSV